MRKLSSFTHGRDNNFNLIRFIAAALVILSHSYPLTGSAPEPLGAVAGFTFGHLAVDIFFITSGFLVTASLLKRSHLRSFVQSRVARIYPGLIVAVAFCAYVIGPLFTTLPLTEYLQSPVTHNFFVHNSLLVVKPIQYALPGVFEHLPVKNAVNGSLWTLPGEVLMYAMLAVLGLITLHIVKTQGLRRLQQLVTGIAIIATILYLANHHTTFIQGAHLPHFVRFASMFFMGGLYYIYREKIPLSGYIFLPLLALVLYTSMTPGKLSFAVYSVALPYLILYIAYVPGGILRTFNKLGDYSYGLYIYAFPIQQSLVYLNPEISAPSLFLAAAPITLLLAVLSWHFVEKPSLARWRGKPDQVEPAQ